MTGAEDGSHLWMMDILVVLPVHTDVITPPQRALSQRNLPSCDVYEIKHSVAKQKSLYIHCYLGAACVATEGSDNPGAARRCFLSHYLVGCSPAVTLQAEVLMQSMSRVLLQPTGQAEVLEVIHVTEIALKHNTETL